MKISTLMVTALTAASGLTTCLQATVVQYQVSHVGLNDWQSSIAAVPGDSIEIRARVTYTGTAPNDGLGSVVFQPTVSNWTPADALAPFVNGGVGSNTTVPSGAAHDDVPGEYGRISPWATVVDSSSVYLRGFVNTFGGTTYLRISHSNASNWIGQSGNTSGAAGINIKEWAEFGTGRLPPPYPQEPPFVADDADLVVFKFKVTLSAGDLDLRTLVVDTPTDGFGNYDTATQTRYAHWYASPYENVGSINDPYTTSPATITVVPTPGTVGTGALLLLACERRRRL